MEVIIEREFTLFTSKCGGLPQHHVVVVVMETATASLVGENRFPGVTLAVEGGRLVSETPQPTNVISVRPAWGCAGILCVQH